MSISLLFKNLKMKQIGTVYLDATLSEKHSMSATITDNPVEEGENVSDHIILDPETLSIEGFITNSPITFMFAGAAILIGNPVQRGFDNLRALMAARQPVEVVTGLKKYKDMGIADLTFPRDPDTGEALKFTVELKKVNKVSSKTVTISEAQVKGSKKIKNQAQSQKNAGKQGTSEVKQGSRDSILSNIGKLNLGP